MPWLAEADDTVHRALSSPITLGSPQLDVRHGPKIDPHIV